mmetsp:Transcript_8846/g.19492  ORF Transcript_8846/g.19492 Transcript_8846/m.19492 type:complete len:328 (-) Transcript_8846:16-999(-)
MTPPRLSSAASAAVRRPPRVFLQLLLSVAVVVRTSSSSLPTGRSFFSNIAAAERVVSRGGSTSSFDTDVLSFLQSRWKEARDLALLEQEVEDYNAEEVIARAMTKNQANGRRRLIAMPLDEALFDPPMGSFSHGHVQTGDKMSLPVCFWRVIQGGEIEVPWLFEISRIEGVTAGPRVPVPPPPSSSSRPRDPLSSVVGGPIDFRAPSNYVFLPRWMFVALGLRPRDVVDVRFVEDVPPGSAVRLRPHETAFTKITDHRSVLETELRHYSALTAGTTIAFDYDGRRYQFDVVDLRSAPKGEKVPMVKVTDCDVAVDFIRPRDQLKENN